MNKTEEKKIYETPDLKELELQIDSIIAASDTDMNNGGDILRPRELR